MISGCFLELMCDHLHCYNVTLLATLRSSFYNSYHHFGSDLQF
jgi:hypothetical protein